MTVYLLAAACILLLLLVLLLLRREKALRCQCLHDDLTGLYNRAAFCRKTEKDYAALPSLGILYWDMDGLKTINDRYGHAAGDRMLRRMAALLRRLTDERCDVFRIGGDEFVIIVKGADEQALSTLLDAWEQLSAEAEVHASVGSALGKGSELPALLDAADRNMYEKKRR